MVRRICRLSLSLRLRLSSFRLLLQTTLLAISFQPAAGGLDPRPVRDFRLLDGFRDDDLARFHVAKDVPPGWSVGEGRVADTGDESVAVGGEEARS